MKYLYHINKWSLITTLILYLTVYLGAMAQIFLGGVQVLSAFVLFLFWEQLDFNSKKLMGTYWAVVIVYGFSFLFIENQVSRSLVFLIIIPMSIAIYFVYILHLIYQHLLKK